MRENENKKLYYKIRKINTSSVLKINIFTVRRAREC